jgi:prepilin-type processing-associated H-X9-DG protein
MNAYMGIRGASLVSPLTIYNTYKIYTKSSDVAADAPAGRFVFADVNPASICTPGFGVDMTARTWIHYPSGLHSGKGVIGFADGHVEPHRWVDPRTTPRTGIGDYLAHATPSPDNPDLAWLAAQTSSQK